MPVRPITSGLTDHVRQQMVARGVAAPVVRPKTLLKKWKKGKAERGQTYEERWRYTYQGYVYIIDPDHTVIITVMSEELYEKQRGFLRFVTPGELRKKYEDGRAERTQLKSGNWKYVYKGIIFIVSPDHRVVIFIIAENGRRII